MQKYVICLIHANEKVECCWINFFNGIDIEFSKMLPNLIVSVCTGLSFVEAI